MKWAGLACVGLMASTATAADHADGPAAASSPSGDIADVYAWAPDTTNLVMIQTIVGDFSEDVQYVFHVGRSEMPALISQPDSWTNVICTFDANSNVACWAGDSDYVSGDATGANGITSANGTLQVHTGLHADPFYFYLTGYAQTVGAVIAAAPGLTPNAAGCPGVDMATSAALVGTLNGTAPMTGPAVNNFAAANVNAVVVELDKTLIAGTGEHFSIYASTHNAN